MIRKRGDDKVGTYEELRHLEKEGIVFKEIDASFEVTGINRQRSVTLAIYGVQEEAQALLPAGNVTIPPNQDIPQIGTIVEVRYLYAFSESGCIYQPVYLNECTDVPDTDCTTDQLKYKAEPIAA